MGRRKTSDKLEKLLLKHDEALDRIEQGFVRIKRIHEEGRPFKGATDMMPKKARKSSKNGTVK